MAMRKRTALTINVNQENTRLVKPVTNGAITQRTRQGPLGEIGNKVNLTRGTEPIDKAKVSNKPIVKPSIVAEVNKVEEKPATRAPKPILKKEQPVKIEPKEEKTKEPEAFSSDLLPIEDIDEIDRDNPVLVSIYSNDIYNYLRQLEKQYPISRGFLSGQEVTPKMRSVLIDWLVEVHQQFRLLQETLYLTVAIIDRFLEAVRSVTFSIHNFLPATKNIKITGEAHRTITRKRLQLVGVVAMFIACKYEEMYSPDTADFVYITDNAYTKTEILQMEMVIMKTLDYSLGRPLPLHFLRRYSKAGRALPIHHTMAKYFLEQCLVHYELAHHPPSLIAAAAMYLAFFVIGHEDNADGQVIWPSTLVHYSTYKRDDLMLVVRDIAAAIVNAEKSKYQAVVRKYTHAKHMKISLRPELKSPAMLALANVAKKEYIAHTTKDNDEKA